MSSIHSLAYRLRFNRVQSAAVGTQQRLTHPQCTGARQGNNTVHVINIVMPRWENETFDSESTHCYKMISGMTQSTLVHEVLKSVRSHLNGPGLWKSHYLEDQIISVFEFLIEFHKGGTSHNNVLEQLAGMGLTTRNDSKNLLLNSIFHAVFYSIICTQGLFCTPSLYSNLTALKKKKKHEPCHRNIICLLVDIHQYCTHIYQRVGQADSPRANLVNVYISWLIWVEKRSSQ